MKKLILLPITLTALTPMISMVGCGDSQYKAIPIDYLKISVGTDGSPDKLMGFKSEYSTLESINGYNTLAIPRNVGLLDDAAFTYDGGLEDNAPLAIKKVTFESNCICKKFGDSSFMGCANLETVIFPPKFNYFQDSTNSVNTFGNCGLLSTFDLTHIEGAVAFDDHEKWIGPNAGFPDSGKIIYRRNSEGQAKFAKKLLDSLVEYHGKTGWIVVPK